jgi:hypothetical protein
MAGMSDIIARIDALLANTPPSEIEEFEVTRCLRDCRDEIIAARACAEMMLQGTGQRLAEGMAERVINGQTVGAWIAVSERLPEQGVPVLAWFKSPVTSMRPYAEVTLLGLWNTWQHNNQFDKVTHWTPLPEPPESTTRVPSLVVNVIKLTPREERAMARAVQLGVEAAVTGPQPFTGSRKVNN